METLLFAASFSGYPLEFSSEPNDAIGPGRPDVVVAKGLDGARWTVTLDRATHLPSLLSWLAVRLEPSTSDVTFRAPGAGIAQWETTVGDYRVDRGVNWPHKLTTWSNGKMYQEIKISTYMINPKIDPKTFAPTK